MKIILIMITLCFFSLKAQSEDIGIMVEFKNVPQKRDLQRIRFQFGALKIVRFDNYESDYFKRLYKLEFKGDEKELIEKLQQNDTIKRVERIFAE